MDPRPDLGSLWFYAQIPDGLAVRYQLFRGQP